MVLFDLVWYGSCLGNPWDMPCICFRVYAKILVFLGQNSCFDKVWHGLVWFGMVLNNPWDMPTHHYLESSPDIDSSIILRKKTGF